MRALAIALDQLSTSDLAKWRELAERALEPNPFYEPEYVLPLAGELGQLADTRLLVAVDADGWQACLPVHDGHWHRIPLRSLAAWRGHVLYGLLGTPLVAADRPRDALAVLVAAMLRQPRRPRFAALEGFAEDGSIGRLLAEQLEERSPRGIFVEWLERAALRRRPEPTYVEEALSTKRRRELRRQRRKLEEALGGEVVTVDRSQEDASFAELIALEAASRKALRGAVLAADPRHARFFKRMCRGFADRGRLQLLSLQGAGQTLALQCNLIAGDNVFRLKMSYAERWAAYSPGMLLEIDGIRIFHESAELTLMDSCADANNAAMNRILSDRRRLATIAFPAEGRRGWAVAPTLRLARSLREWNRRRRKR